ncbi:cytochrome p450 [Moniliophthora roreri]|nr:cytochrome p450 [Moniliophthora roreri]
MPRTVPAILPRLSRTIYQRITVPILPLLDLSFQFRHQNTNTRFTVQAATPARFINLFPEFMRGFRATVHLKPVIEERLRMQEEYGRDWPGKPFLVPIFTH